LWQRGGDPGASASAPRQDGWWPRSSRTLRDSRGFSRSSCSSASSSGGTAGGGTRGDTLVTPQQCHLSPSPVPLGLTDAGGDVLARHADAQHHGEAARGTAPRGAQGPVAVPGCHPHAGGVPAVVSPRRCPHPGAHQLTRVPDSGRTQSRTSGCSPSGTLSWARATTTGCPLGEGTELRGQGTAVGTPRAVPPRDGHSPVHGHLGRPVSPHQQICGDKQGVGDGVVAAGWHGGGTAVAG